MGLDFGDRGCFKGDLKQIAAISCGHDVIIDNPVDQLFGFTHGIKSGVCLTDFNNVACFIHYHQFNGARADVDPCEKYDFIRKNLL